LGRDGSNDEGSHIWLENWPARAERICSRTGRCGDDQTVGLIARNELQINKKLEVIQACDGALAYHQFVQGGVRGDNFASSQQRAIQHRAAVNDIMLL